MIHELYINLSLVLTAGLLLACGLMFLFLDAPRTPLLEYYRKVRYVMTAAYLFFAAVNVLQYLFVGGYSESGVVLFHAITLIIAVSQAALFTLSLIALLEVKFPGWSYIFAKLAPAIAIITAILAVFLFCSQKRFDRAFFVFCALYALLLGYYTRLFWAVFRKFRFRMDNYFSDRQTEQMHWVAVSFFVALAIGVMALLSAVFAFLPAELLFSLVFCSFYVWFALRFINYAHRFHAIEQVLDNDTEEFALPESEMPDVVDISIIKEIEKLMSEDKLFKDAALSIDLLARKLGVKRYHVSAAINRCMKKSFKTFVNEYRIKEAIQFLSNDDDDTTIDAIAFNLGFNDRYNFYRVFKKITKQSPTDFKKNKVDLPD